MVSDPFNSVGGLTVGIPPVNVVNANGVVVANINNDYILANTVLTNNLRYSNGVKYVPGSNGQIVFNSSNIFAASPNLTFNTATDFLSVQNIEVIGTTNLGDASQVSILGGQNGYVLQTDGLGQLTWVAQTGGNGGNGNPGGSNSQVQYNDAGVFGGDPGFTYNEITNTLNVGNITSNFIGNLNGFASNAVTANTVTVNSQPNITSLGTLTSLSVSGQVEALIFQGNAGNLSNIPAANISGIVAVAATVSNAAQPNITSLGTLTTLNVSGNTSTANLSASNRATAGNLFVTGNASFGGNVFMNTGNFIANGNVDFNGPSVELGQVGNIRIFGGFTGQVLTTDGAGTLSWTDAGGGGNGAPGGGNTQVQFNNGGVFGGVPNFTYNSVTQTVTVAGNLIANTFQVGSGAFNWSTSKVFFATTNSMTPSQVLYSVPIADVSGVQFEIIATDPVGLKRQSCKISSLYYNGIVDFTEFATILISGGVGNFDVDFFAGNVSVPPSLQLKISPSTTNTVTYKMLITQFAP